MIVGAPLADNNNRLTSGSAYVVNGPVPADLAITKADSPDPVTVGDQITYNLAVANNGPVDATGVQALDTLPAGVTYLPGPSDSRCSLDAGEVTCVFGSIPNGESRNADIFVRADRAGAISNTATVDGDQPDSTAGNDSSTVTTTVDKATTSLSTTASDDIDLGGKIHDTATLSGGAGPTGSISFSLYGPGDPSCTGAPAFTDSTNVDSGNGSYDSDDFHPDRVRCLPLDRLLSGDANNTTSAGACGDAGESVVVNPASDLAITKTDSPDPVTVGDQITYNLAVTNNGPSPATGVAATDTLPAGVTFEPAADDSRCSFAAGEVTCEFGSLVNGGSADADIVVSADRAGTITNIATVSGDQPDPVGGNDSSSATTTVDPAPTPQPTPPPGPGPQPQPESCDAQGPNRMRAPMRARRSSAPRSPT